MGDVAAFLAIGVGQIDGDSILAHLLDGVILLANLTGGLVVGVGTLRGLIWYLRDLISLGPDVPREQIRLSLGRSLALALEFQLGADIVSTARNPTREDIAILAAIIVLRTLLNFFLQRELQQEAAKQRAAGGQSR
jgi:uncharacterized membrane protein